MSYGCFFNGVDSKIDLGSDMISDKTVTIMGWIKPYGWGAFGNFVYTNGKVICWVRDTEDNIGFSSNGSTTTKSATNSITLNKLQFVAITRESDGTVNFYIGDKNTAPVLSGTADQDSGTPEAGTTSVILGNNSGATRTFDGLIPVLKCVENVLSLQEITRFWSSTLGEIR